MKILFLDIETSPNVAHVWGLWDQNVGLNQLIQATDILCWCAKWHGSKKTFFSSIYHNTKEEMIAGMHALMDEADVIVHYNGKKFDIPTLNREFLLAGLPPPAPAKHLDLLMTVRSKFKFPSNKLQYVAKALGLGGKEEHEGHTLWIKCMDMQPAAWAKMKKYNIKDVTLLEDLYLRIRPWITNHPSVAAYTPNHDVCSCPSCGSVDYQKRGTSKTAASVFQRLQCNACGSWFKSPKKIATLGGYRSL